MAVCAMAAEAPGGAAGRASLALQAGRSAAKAADIASLVRALAQVADLADDLPTWISAAGLLRNASSNASSSNWARREIRLAVAGSHTTSHLAALLPVALARHGIATEIHEAPYGQYEQQIRDPQSALTSFAPDVVLLLIDERDVRFPQISPDPRAELAAETQRWTSLWSALREHTGATIIQTTFVPRADDVLGHLALTTPGSRRRMIRALNLDLGDLATGDVHLVDAEQLASAVGSRVWSDDKYWFVAKQSFGLGAIPALARELAAVTAAALGLTRKVLVLDLDNTLWGGVIGEDGLSGIELGGGARGEAYQAVQEHALALRRRGVLLTVVSKNAEARAAFLSHPDMRLSLDDLVAFRASWDDKAAVIRQLAQDLSLGLDAFVFMDDNPFEREAVREALPEVEVVDLPDDATGYLAALARHPGLEPGILTQEDAGRTAQYQALAQASQSRAAATTPQEYLAGLSMEAVFTPVDDVSLPRVVQLIGKTNQFNLTARRHRQAEVEALTGQDRAVHLTLRMRDRYADHGLVGVVLAVPDGEDLRVDTWLMSCRVLGRGAEVVTMRAIAEVAHAKGFRRIVGEHVATGRNEPAREAYPRCGFTALSQDDDVTVYALDLQHDTVPDPGIIAIQMEPPAHKEVDLHASARRDSILR
jgi:FkbH-like protein